MDKVGDRLLLWLCGFALLWSQPSAAALVVAMLAALTVSALNGYSQSRVWMISSCAAYVICCFVWPAFGLFLPLVCYDLFAVSLTAGAVGALAGTIGVWSTLPLPTVLLVIVLLIVAGWLQQRTSSLRHLRRELVDLDDHSREFSLGLQQQNKDLQEKQDYGVRLATLNERNRIAREIHDQVGHLLSRSLLQVGAMLATKPASILQQGLGDLRETLAQAMDSIRASVHDLHEDSVDLQMQLTDLVQSWLFCPINFDYRLSSKPDKPVQYCFIAVVKEGLHNISRHSDASQVSLRLLEHPALYQLVLQDNGSRNGAAGSQALTAGLGLENMRQRVEALNGQFLAGYADGGWRVFVSVPKER